VIFIDLRLMKNIIFNKTESLVGRNTCDHACQIFCSKGNCETMYHWFFLLEITVVKIMNNLNVCSAHSYLYPQFRFNWVFIALASSVVCHGFEPRLGQTKDYEIGIWYFSTKHTTLLSDSKVWMAWDENVSVSTCILLFQWVSTINILLSMSV